MKQFLLLRSNKQSGPYSAEDLKQMGLKPYDLIWVEGKSAAWRYPGEIDELKSFAPPVEEQPYDRFYKKSETAAKNQQSVPDTNTTIAQTPPAVQQPEKPPIKKEKEYKRVFVTLPATPTNGNGYSNGNSNSDSNTNSSANNNTPSTPVEKPATEKKQEYAQYMPKEKNPEPAPSAYVPPIDQPQPEPVPIRNEPAPVKKQPVYKSKPVIADELPEEVYFPRKKSSRIKPFGIAAVAAAMVGMVALGIWIGVSINKKDNGVSLIKKVDRVPNNNNGNQNDGGLIGPTQTNNVPAVLPDTTTTGTQQPVLSTQTKKPARIPAASNVTLTNDSMNQEVASSEKKDSGEATGDDLRIKKPISKPTMPDLEKLVSVSTNDYKVGPFGGISKLELTVTNSSDYALNLVVVQVEYLKVNKEVFKTENIYFRDMGANSSLTLDAPRSNRGNAINYKVTLINSKDHLFHTGN